MELREEHTEREIGCIREGMKQGLRSESEKWLTRLSCAIDHSAALVHDALTKVHESSAIYRALYFLLSIHGLFVGWVEQDACENRLRDEREEGVVEAEDIVEADLS